VSAEVAITSLPLGTGAGGFVAGYLPAQARRVADLPFAEAARRAHDVVDAHHDWLAALAVLGVPAWCCSARRSRPGSRPRCGRGARSRPVRSPTPWWR
jgi:hypothetical protein